MDSLFSGYNYINTNVDDSNIDYFSEEVSSNLPGSENFLQRAIKQARGLSPLGLLPSSGEEIADVPRAIGSVLNPISMMKGPAAGAGIPPLGLARMFGAGPSIDKFATDVESSIAPKTPYGRNLETMGQVAMLLSPFAEAAPGKIAGLGKSIKGIFTNPGMIEKEISDAISLAPQQLRMHKMNIMGKAMMDFERGLSAERGLTNSRAIGEAIQRASAQHGGAAALGSDAEKLWKLGQKYLGYRNEVTGLPISLNAGDVQAILAETTNNPALRRTLVNELVRSVGPDMPSLEGLRTAYSNAATKEEWAGRVTKKSLERLGGRGKPLGTEEMDTLRSAEWNYLDYPNAPRPVQNIAKLKQQLDKAKKTRNIATVGMGVGGLPWLLSKIFPKQVVNTIVKVAS